MAGLPWTDDELALASDPGLSHVQVAQRTGRSVNAVKKQRRRLANPELVHAKRHAYYESNRERILGKHLLYNATHGEEIRARARARTAQQRASATTRYGAPFQTWEDELIMEPDASMREVAARLGRTLHAVRARRAKLRWARDTG